uniref:Bestrophin homolog n=1 Tax=Rhabditophanes sp. KR3021 TaxID=114890 RepID=A0AC35THN4_9BILA
MTVSYTCDVASSDRIGMLKILFKWKGSMWKSVLFELVVWIFSYSLLALLIRNCLNYEQLEHFKNWRTHLTICLTRIPLVFLLGFFVSVVFNRWMEMFKRIGFIDNVALTLTTYVPDNDPECVQMRRNVVRYCVLSQALVFRDISIEVRKRYPELSCLVDAGLMTQRELDIYNRKESWDTKYWMPIQWSLSIVQDLRFKHTKIMGDPYVVNIVDRIRDFRTDLQLLCCYDWVPVPLSYPQIVYLVVRVYFSISLIARQGLHTDEVDYYIPLMTIIEFFFVVGWVKVAEALLNPFGEDDDDFECSYLLDRNLLKGMDIVQGFYGPGNHEVDLYKQMSIAKPILSKKSVQTRRPVNPYKGSVAGITIANSADGLKKLAASSIFSHDSSLYKVGPSANNFKDSMLHIRKMSTSIAELDEYSLDDSHGKTSFPANDHTIKSSLSHDNLMDRSFVHDNVEYNNHNSRTNYSNRFPKRVHLDSVYEERSSELEGRISEVDDEEEIKSISEESYVDVVLSSAQAFQKLEDLKEKADIKN